MTIPVSMSMSMSMSTAMSAKVMRTESELIRALRARDESAFEELVRSNSRRMMAVARRLLGNDHDAEDALQETFLAAYRSIAKFRGKARLSTWLHRILVNVALMKLRRRRRKPEEPIEAAPLEATRASDDLERAFEKFENERMVWRAMDRLAPQHRGVLLLRDFNEWDTQTTARGLGISENAVKVRLCRARRALRRAVDAEIQRPAREMPVPPMPPPSAPVGCRASRI